MYTSLLVPLDGSAEGEQALPIARSIASQNNATLHFVHVHVPQSIIHIDGMPVVDDQLRSLSHEHERAYLEAIATRLAADTDLTIHTATLDGSIVSTLLDYALAHAVDLIVMTTHGRGGLARAWLGSVADALVRQNAVPVLLSRPTHEPVMTDSTFKLRRILLPTDGSLPIEELFAPAAALDPARQAIYTLLQVVPLASSFEFMPYKDSATDQAEARRHAAQDQLEAMADQIRSNGATAETAVLAAHQAANAILQYADERQVDLIVMATHGRSGVKRMLLGSVTDKVLRGATCPVLIFRLPEGPI